MIKTFVFYFTTLGTYKIVEQKQLVHYILSQMIQLGGKLSIHVTVSK